MSCHGSSTSITWLGGGGTCRLGRGWRGGADGGRDECGRQGRGDGPTAPSGVPHTAGTQLSFEFYIVLLGTISSHMAKRSADFYFITVYNRLTPNQENSSIAIVIA